MARQGSRHWNTCSKQSWGSTISREGNDPQCVTERAPCWQCMRQQLSSAAAKQSLRTKEGFGAHLNGWCAHFLKGCWSSCSRMARPNCVALKASHISLTDTIRSCVHEPAAASSSTSSAAVESAALWLVRRRAWLCVFGGGGCRPLRLRRSELENRTWPGWHHATDSASGWQPGCRFRAFLVCTQLGRS